MSDGMTPTPQPTPDPTQEVAKRRSGLMVALLGILLVIAAIVGVAYFTGIGPFGTQEPELESTGPKAPPESAEEETVTPVAATATVPLPPGDAQAVMYWEQVASQEQIGKLVADEIGSFDLSQIAENGDTADIRVKVTYRDGGTLSGWMLLREYDGAWYFAAITADGNPATTPISGTTDADVMKAIVEQQAANQEIYKAILDGGYTVMVVDGVTQGSGTATVKITLSGGSAPEAKGTITCISKTTDGTTQWFITSFSKA